MDEKEEMRIIVRTEVMRMQPKNGRAWLLFCTFILSTSSAGCRRASGPLDVPAAPHRGVELRIACPTDETADQMRGPGQAWALRQGVQIQVLRYNVAAGPEAAGKADIWILPPADLPRWAAAGQLTAVPADYTKSDNSSYAWYAWIDLLPAYREQLIPWEGTPYGWALVGESPLCCYRKDLFQDAAHQAAFRKEFGHALDAPATWEQFAHIAEYFHQHGPHGTSAPSLPPLPRADADLDRLFYTVAAGFARHAVSAEQAPRGDSHDDVFSFHYDVKTGQPRIATPGFVHALQLLGRLQACRPTGLADHPEEAFRDGRAVLCLADAPWLKVFQKAPALRDKIGICRVPGGDRYFDFATGLAHPAPEVNRVPYLGGAGWLGVVPRSAEHPAAAFDLLADLSGPKTSAQVFLGESGAGGPIRGEQLSRDRWDSFDLAPDQTLQLQKTLRETLLHRGLKNPALCLRLPRQAAHRAALLKEVRGVLLHNADAGKSLQNVAAAWKKLDDEQGVDALQADYRRSLGLRVK
jgi:multiple sugar transport system substrate-binding protein